ncbi:MAG: hypothetical protein IKU79_03810 [Bacteroidaceae bacterium]|nr:hypothetical protein [Bacteroidaceae bacterium]
MKTFFATQIPRREGLSRGYDAVAEINKFVASFATTESAEDFVTSHLPTIPSLCVIRRGYCLRQLSLIQRERNELGN